MTIEATITHGLSVGIDGQSPNVAQVELGGGVHIVLAEPMSFECVVALGPVGMLIDTSDYYKRADVDVLMASKQDQLVAGKDIYLNGNVIDNEHEFFTNWEIENVWNSVDV